MKKLLLTSACVLGAMLVANAEATLTTVWLNEGVQGKEGTIRQGVGRDGKMYLLNSTYAWGQTSHGYIEVWGADGLEGQIKLDDEGDINGTNITIDDAGNIVGRIGTFPNPFSGDGGVFIYTPEGEMHTFNLDTSVLKDGRADNWGHIAGNVMSEEGGLLLFGCQNADMFNEVRIIDGEHVVGGQQGIKNTYYYGDGAFSGTMSMFSVYDWLPNEAAFLQENSYSHPNKLSPLYHLSYDKSGETWVWRYDGTYFTPERNLNTGFALFKMGEQVYIIYSRGGNNADAFAIAKAVVVPLGEECNLTTEDVMVYRKWGIMNADETDSKYYASNLYSNYFNVEVAEDGKTASIYQYCPGKFVAMFTFTPDTTDGIETVEAETDAAPVYYNMQGVRVANPERGIYIEVRGNKARKVLK